VLISFAEAKKCCSLNNTHTHTHTQDACLSNLPIVSNKSNTKSFLIFAGFSQTLEFMS